LGGAALLAALASPARADLPVRLDHRGAVGLSLDVGVEHAVFLGPNGKPVPNLEATRAVLDVSGSAGLTHDGNEFVLELRLLRGPDWGGALAAAYRVYFGREEWKTFANVGAKADTTPRFALGPNIGMGVMYEVTPVFGLFASASASLEFGAGIRGAFDAAIGLQGRSYLLE
jgi:hypothetical protein